MLLLSVAEQKDESSPSQESLRFDVLCAELALTAGDHQPYQALSCCTDSEWVDTILIDS